MTSKTNNTNRNGLLLTKLIFVLQARMNQFLMQSEDMAQAAMAQMSKQKDVTFAKL